MPRAEITLTLSLSLSLSLSPSLSLSLSLALSLTLSLTPTLIKARRLADGLHLPSAAELRYTGLTGCLESPG